MSPQLLPSLLPWGVASWEGRWVVVVGEVEEGRCAERRCVCRGVASAFFRLRQSARSCTDLFLRPAALDGAESTVFCKCAARQVSGPGIADTPSAT